MHTVICALPDAHAVNSHILTCSSTGLNLNFIFCLERICPMPYSDEDASGSKRGRAAATASSGSNEGSRHAGRSLGPPPADSSGHGLVRSRPFLLCGSSHGFFSPPHRLEACNVGCSVLWAYQGCEGSM